MVAGNLGADEGGQQSYNDGESALKVKRWFHRTADDATGCTFIEWDAEKEAAAGAPPVAMIVSQLHKAAWHLWGRAAQTGDAACLGPGPSRRHTQGRCGCA